MLLTQIISVAFAQNLFCLAVLLTPTPLSEEASHHISHYINASSNTTSSTELARLTSDSVGGKIRLEKAKSGINKLLTPKTASWTPHPILHLFPLTISFVCIFLTPFATNLASFTVVCFLPQFHMYLHALLPFLVPMSWGSTSTSSKANRDRYSRIFRFIAVASFLFHFKATLVALLDNTPDSHRHRHSILFFKQDEERSRLERGWTAIEKVVGAINDHPAVSHAAWDAILSGITAVIWATIRGVDVKYMLQISIPFYQASKNTLKRNARKLIEGVKDAKPKSKGRSQSAGNDSITSTSSEKTPKRTKKEHASIGEQDYTPDRGSARKTSAKGFMGEELKHENTESGALAWGLTTLGGVGLGAASVWGSEVVANS